MTTIFEEVNTETLSQEEKDQMERHAEATQTIRTIMPTYHEDTMEYDAETFDSVTHAIMGLVDALCDPLDETLAWDRKMLTGNVVRQAEYLIKRKESALKSLAWKANRAQRECVHDEISTNKKQDAINDWSDCMRQLQNLQKHFLPAAKEAWENMFEEPYSSDKPASPDRTDVDDLKINEIMKKSGIADNKKS